MTKKALIFEIKRFAVHDGDGIRSTVFFKGCPLKCVWCHNPEGISYKSEVGFYAHKCNNCHTCVRICDSGANTIIDETHSFDSRKCNACGKCERACTSGAIKLYGKEMSVQNVFDMVIEDKIFYEQSDGGVTLSGGECLSYPDFCSELLSMLKAEGVNTAVDTCGYVNRQSIDKVIPYTDVFLYDLKAIDEDVHIKCTGKSNKIILENLSYIDSQNKSIEVRIPYVPEYNGGEIEKIADFLSELKNLTKVRVLPYHNYASSKYSALEMENTLPKKLPSEEEILRAKNILRERGITVVD